MVKKPKKDSSPPQPLSLEAVRTVIVTQIPPKGKMKNKVGG